MEHMEVKLRTHRKYELHEHIIARCTLKACSPTEIWASHKRFASRSSFKVLRASSLTVGVKVIADFLLQSVQTSLSSAWLPFAFNSTKSIVRSGVSTSPRGRPSLTLRRWFSYWLRFIGRTRQQLHLFRFYGIGHRLIGRKECQKVVMMLTFWNSFCRFLLLLWRRKISVFNWRKMNRYLIDNKKIALVTKKTTDSVLKYKSTR